MTPGIKTSEIWVLIAYMATILANGTTFINVPWEVMTAAMIPVTAYLAGRSVVKAATKNGASE